MIDYISFSNYFNSLRINSECIKGKIKRDRWNKEEYQLYLIPNQTGKEFMKLKSYSHSDKCTIYGNLRKWRFGRKNAVRDLNKGDFVECIDLISRKIGVDEDEIWESEIRKIELGGNLKLDSKYASIIPSLIRYPQLKRDRYNEETVYFGGSKYHIIFYNKILELSNRRIIKKHTADSLLEKVFVLRYEKRIKAKSGVLIKDKIGTLEDVYNNWDDLIEDWLESLSKVDYIDLFSDSKEILPNSIPPGKWINYLAYQTIKRMTVEKVIDFTKIYVKNRKSVAVKKVIDLFNDFTDTGKRNYFTHITSVAALKAKEMKSETPKFWV